MKTGLAALALAVSPALAIPPPNFGFPEAPNDTALTVTYSQGNGRYVPVTEAELFGINVPQNQPVVAVNTSAYRSLANYSGNYVLIMVDPDAQYPENPNYRFYLHWMQANLTQSNNSTMNQSLSLTAGNRQLVNMSAPVVPYARPAPPTNSSAHRYIFYSFQQPDNFSIPSQWSGLNAMNRTKFNLTNFIADTNLGTPAAANFMYVSNQSRVPDDFVAAAGSQYPGGDGTAVTSGDPSQATGGSSGSGSGSNSGSGGSGSSGSNGGSGGSSSSSTSSAGAAMITGAGSLLGAGILGFAALI